MTELGTATAAHPGSLNGADSSRVTARIEELGRASRLSAVISGIGLTILTGSLALAAWRLGQADSKARAVEAQVSERRAQLHELETALSRRQADLDSIALDVDAKTKQLETTKKQLAGMQELVAKSKDTALLKQAQTVAPFKPLASIPVAPTVPLEQVARVSLAVAPTSRTAGDLPLYDIRYSVNLPKDRALEVLKVEYFFDHSSFVPQTKTSLDPASGFAIKYLGWGCLRSVKVTLAGKDGGRHELPAFDMCAAEAWAQRPRPAR